jgi:hypothetical protein
MRPKVVGVLAATGIAVGFMLAALPVGAQAEEPALTFVFNSPDPRFGGDGFPRGEENRELLLETTDVPADLVGLECTVEAVAQNMDDPSIHLGNDFILRSPADPDDVVIPNFESGVGETEGFGTLILGNEVSLFLKFGEDEVSSGGVRVNLFCIQVSPAPPVVRPPVPPQVGTPPSPASGGVSSGTPATSSTAVPAQAVAAQATFTG